jgi:sarcosine oxidase subunit alpha
MAERIEVRIDGRTVEVEAGISVSAALWNAGVGRGPLCAMGICFECRVTIDGVRHRRACTTTVAPGLEIASGG